MPLTVNDPSRTPGALRFAPRAFNADGRAVLANVHVGGVGRHARRRVGEEFDEAAQQRVLRAIGGIEPPG